MRLLIPDILMGPFLSALLSRRLSSAGSNNNNNNNNIILRYSTQYSRDCIESNYETNDER